MKYIKTYEELETQYTVDDFMNIKYWRYTNSQGTNVIFKIDSIENLENDYNFDLIILNLTNKSFDYQNFNLMLMRAIITLEDSRKLLRPATDDEIEEFDDMYKTVKYNL